MQEKGAREKELDGMSTKGTLRDQDGTFPSSSRQSLTTITEEQSEDRSSFDTRRMPGNSNLNSSYTTGLQMSKVFDELDVALQNSVHNLMEELWGFLGTVDMQANCRASFSNFMRQQEAKAIGEVSAGLDRCEYYFQGLLGRPSENSEAQLGDFWLGEGKPGLDARRTIEDRANSLRSSFNQELQKLRSARLQRLTALFENQLASRGKQFFSEMRKQMRTGSSLEEQTGLLLALKQKNAENSEFIFNMRRSIEELQAKLNKL
jgi:hypothetical protein